MGKHTPGPWETNEGYPDMVQHQSEKKGDYFFIAETNERATKEEQYANAKLIAAAPDLLAALKEVMTMLEPIEGYMSVAWANNMKHIRKAIAKAEGSE